MARRRTEAPPVPLLDALPAELRHEASPLRCVCACCHPELTAAERAAERATQEQWSAARRAWLTRNGWTDVDLFWAEVHARSNRSGRATKRRPSRTTREGATP